MREMKGHQPYRTALLGIAFLLTGCASLSDIQAELKKKPPCCQSFDEFAYVELSADAPSPIKLDEQSPVFEFDVGKSYFAAFSLPASSIGRRLQFYSMATGSVAFEPSKLAQIFCPRVLFLNEKKAVISAEEQMPVYDTLKDFGTILRGAGSEAIVPDGARFAVVHSNPSRYGKFVNRYDGPSGYMVGSAYVHSNGAAVPFPCAPVANSLVRLQ